MEFTKAEVPEPAWIGLLFSAARANGGPLIRNKNAIPGNRTAAQDLEDLKAACQKRNFHLLQTGNYYIVICNDGEIRVHC